jgi:hypothetical protein
VWWCCVQDAVNASLDTLAGMPVPMEPMDNVQMLVQMTTNGVRKVVCSLIAPVAELLCGEGYCT